jgi:integrase
MPRQPSVPSYRLHKQSGQAIVTLRDGFGNCRDVLLGEYGTPESRTEYARVIAEWEASKHRLPGTGGTPGDLTIAELLERFWAHAELHYRHPDGSPTSEQDNYRHSLRPLRELYDHTLVRDFGPLCLKAVRQKMIDGGICRSQANQRIQRIKHVFKWAVGEELVPASVWHALQCVSGLQRGRTEARETEPVKPVAVAIVEETLPFLMPEVADMVRLQLLTGCRPGEVCLLRACDIDMTGDVWTYCPKVHKTAWRGNKRQIMLGPKAQEIVRRYLRPQLDAYLFSPAVVMKNREERRRAVRKSKVQPSQKCRKKKGKRERKPGERYTTRSYAHAIYRACDLAYPPPPHLGPQEKETEKGTRLETKEEWMDRLSPEEKEELKRWRSEHRWHPNQLRHTRATEIRRLAGLDAARVLLGHTTPIVTEIYAELDSVKAAEVARQHG